MTNTPLNPDDAEEATLMWRQVSEAIDHEHLDPREFLDLAKLKWLLDRILAVAQPVVNSVEELEALPVGSVLIDQYDHVHELDVTFDDEEFRWIRPGMAPRIATWGIGLPARVLYRPEVPVA